jgi:gamma-glutamyl-gamma-aminobutyrate hydrolase PuuD
MITPVELKRLEDEATMREVYDLRVFVVGGGFQYMKMFFDAGFKGARSVDDANIVCFTGGEDVDPSYYKEKALSGTHYNTKRDEYEAGVFGEALALKRPMIGICRGAQFLNVMNGGSLWQDVNHHAGRQHSVLDMQTGETFEGMTSTHHQQMRPADEAEIVAVATLSTRKESASEKIERDAPECDDMEVLWYPDSLTLCFQPHPEFAHGDCRNYFLGLVDNYIIPAC